MASGNNPASRSRGTRLCTALVALAVVGLTFVAAPSLQAQSFTVLHNFTGGADGGSPFTGLTIDRAGHLYGTTLAPNDLGTVFKMSNTGSGWVLTTLYNFLGVSNGAYPDSDVVFGPDGRLYGATTSGGSTGCGGRGCGIVYALNPSARAPANVLEDWSEDELYTFLGGSDGASPSGSLVFDQAGAIYGTDQVGVNGWGAVYELTRSSQGWSQTVLYNFSGGSDGGGPEGGVIIDQAGNLYGTTAGGGAYGNGVVFRLTPLNGGWTETVLYSFQGPADGSFPDAGLIMDSAGNLYGTTLYGGSGNGGTVFKLSSMSGNWIFALLYSFTGPAGSYGALAMDASGSLYGTTAFDGSYQYGNVFQLTPFSGGWTYTSLHDFTGGADGKEPVGNVVLDAQENVYGTTSSGGSDGRGVVFEITP